MYDSSCAYYIISESIITIYQSTPKGIINQSIYPLLAISLTTYVGLRTLAIL